MATSKQYSKKCSNKQCGKAFKSNYEASNLCSRCGKDSIVIISTSFVDKDLPTPKLEPRLSVAYGSDTYTEGEVNGDSLETLVLRRKKLETKLKNYRKFAKKYGWRD